MDRQTFFFLSSKGAVGRRKQGDFHLCSVDCVLLSMFALRYLASWDVFVRRLRPLRIKSPAIHVTFFPPRQAWACLEGSAPRGSSGAPAAAGSGRVGLRGRPGDGLSGWLRAKGRSYGRPMTRWRSGLAWLWAWAALLDATRRQLASKPELSISRTQSSQTVTRARQGRNLRRRQLQNTAG